MVSTQQLYDSVLNQWLAKTTYGYDSNAIDPQANTAVQHDQSYNASWTVGGSVTRGNVTSVSRWDVTDINNASKALSSTVSYNAAGSALSTTDTAGHTSSLNYTDSFSDGNNHNTFAYPTNATDADGFNSFVKYNFDYGAKTRVEGPSPQNQPNGIVQTFTYDSAARLLQVTTQNNGAYTRYVYGPFWVQSFSTVNTVADEAYSITVFDGVGRAFGTANNHPGSVGGYRLAVTIYDLMGRPILSTRPFEVNNSWVAAGDDAGGVAPTAQSYDWKGRSLVTTNPDGTQKSASYTGCGCAGGEVVTLTDEVGRRQKVYSDVLGRQWKTEVLNWDGSVYATTAATLNARDQATLMRQYSGTDQSTTYQDTTMSFDGYGRLQSKHVPEQNAGAATVYAYNNDDMVYSVTDARGATSTFTYNARHFATAVNYSAPTGINPTSPVSFGYDAAGNRTSMSDGTGTTTYAFDTLSRLASETRTFNGLSGSYTLNYAYNLVGELTSVTDPFGAQVGYDHDSTGRITSVTGSGYGNVSTYASNLQWRASGAMKHLSYGNGRNLDAGYNNRLQVTSFSIAGVMSSQYQYNADGRINFAQDLMQTNSPFDRSYSYDHAARLIEAKTGSQARGGATEDGPYHEGYGFSAFGQLTQRGGSIWTQPMDGFVTTYTNNRRPDWTYDPDGRPTLQESLETTYDAAGRRVREYDPSRSIGLHQHGLTLTQDYDGNGARVKQQQNTFTPTYLLRSSALGGEVIDEIVAVNGVGQKSRGFVYAAGQMLAKQEGGEVTYVHSDPRTQNQWQSNATTSWGVAQVDPLGADAGFTPPPAEPPPISTESDLLYPAKYADIFNGSVGCTIDGAMASCDQAGNSDAFTVLPEGVSATQIVIDRDSGDLQIRGTDFVINSETGTIYKRTWVDTSGDKPAPEQLPKEGTPVDEGDTLVTQGYIPSGYWKYTTVSSGQQPSSFDIHSLWVRSFPCNRSAKDLLSRLRSDFSKFANFTASIGHGLGSASITFQPGPITQGRTIPITANVSSTVPVPGTSYYPNVTRHVSVTVQTVTTTSFTFVTNQGHVLYPGTISFSAIDTGGGTIAASVEAKGMFGDRESEQFFERGGGKEFEERTWQHFLDNLQKSCGSFR